MSEHTYVVNEIVGSSTTSVDDAIQTALATAAGALRNLDWFEVTQIRGTIDGDRIGYIQVGLKVGLRYEPRG